MLVSQILKEKGDLVFTASPTDSVAAVAALLHARKVGAMGMPVDWQAHLAGYAAGVLLIGPFARLAGRGPEDFSN